VKRRAIVLGGSRGIGKAISDSLNKLDCEVISLSSTDLDTSNLQMVDDFISKYIETDILVLNTGGPSPTPFFKITLDDWNHYHNQLFLSFCLILQKLKIKKNGFIFLISSNVIKEPSLKLVVSSAYRTALSSVFKIVSKELAADQISCINIAPGPIKTDRMKDLVDDVDAFEQTLPMKRMGKPEEIGKFVKSIVENDIHYLSGAVINFDGANSKFIF